MTASAPDPADRDERVNAIIADYLNALRAGQAPPREELLARHPDLADELASFLADREQFEHVAAPLRQATPVTIGMPPLPDVATLPPTAPDRAAPLGTIRYFGDYELLEEIARGGMGVVFRARQVSLNRIVALKMILAGRFSSAADVQRFRTEAEASANLDCPNIIPVYEVGEHEGHQYFSMKLIDGGSLAEILARRELPPVRALVRILATVARAVHFAHQRGILHRDLKPANILLTGADATPLADLTPYVTDFGLAKRVGDSRLTHSGAILGTPSYMAPEQARADKALTTAVDVYSLGAILYEVLCGRPPFRAGTAFDTLMQVMTTNPPPPRVIQPAADRDLATIALKCLAKEPARRYGSADALADDLERWLRGKPITARPSTARERVKMWAKRRPAVAALLAVSVLAMLALAGMMAASYSAVRRALDRAEESATESRQRLVRSYIANGTRRLETGDVFGALPWFAEALRLDDGDPVRSTVHRQRLGTLLRLCPTVVAAWVPGGRPDLATFGPDGRSVLIAWSHDHDGKVIAAARLWDIQSQQPLGPVMPLEPSVYGRAAAFASWSPDGGQVLIAGHDRAGIYEPRSGQRVVHWELPQKSRVAHIQGARGGRYVVALEDGQDAYRWGSTGNGQVWDVRTGQAVTPPLGFGKDGLVDGADLSPDGRLLLTTGGHSTKEGYDGAAQLWDVATGKPAGPPLKQAAMVRCAAFSANGQHLAAGSEDGSVQVWDVASGKALPSPSRHTSAIRLIRFSPDGRRIATVDAASDVRLWDAATGQAQGEPIRRGDAAAVEFSPDGSLLAVVNLDDRLTHFVDLASRRDVAPPLPGAEPLGGRFHPDGRRVLSVSAPGVVRLWDLAAGPAWSEPFDLGDHVLGPQHMVGDKMTISDDGRWLADRAGRDRVRVWDLTGRRAAPLEVPTERHIQSLSFSGDGASLVLITGPDARTLEERRAEYAVAVWNLETGRLRFPVWRQVLPLLHNRSGADDPGSVLVVSAESGRLVVVEYPPRAMIKGPDGYERYAEDPGPSTTQLWDLATGRPFGATVRHPAALNDLHLAADGTTMLAVYSDGTARVCAAQTGQALAPPMRHRATTTWMHTSAAYDRLGGRALTVEPAGPSESTLALYGRAGGAPVRHRFPEIMRADFSPDGRTVLAEFNTALEEPTLEASPRDLRPDRRTTGLIRLLDAATGQAIAPPLRAVAEGARFGRFSGDSRLVAVQGKGVAVFDARTAEPLTIPLGTDGVDFALRPEGHYLVTLHDADALRVWDLTPDKRPADDLVRVVRRLTGRVVDATSSSVAVDRATSDADWTAWAGEARATAADELRRTTAWLRDRAEAAERVRDWARAAHVWRQLADAEPARWLAHARAGRAAAAAGRPTEALADFGRAFERGGTGPHLHGARGEVYAALKRFADAAADFGRRRELTGADTDESYSMALLAAGDLARFRADAAQRLRLAPAAESDHATAYLIWVTLLAPDMPSPAPALSRLEQAAKEWRSHNKALGAARYRLGQFDAALAALREAVAAEPDLPAPNLFLAMTLARLGKTDEAQQILDRTRALTAAHKDGAWMQAQESQVLLREAQAVLGIGGDP